MLFLSQSSPLVRAAAFAALYAILVIVLTLIDGQAFDTVLVVRVLLVAAIAFVAQEVIDGLLIQRSLTGWAILDLAVFGYAVGLPFAVTMALGAIARSDSTMSLLVSWGIGGAIYGGLIAMFPPKIGNVEDLKQGYDTAHPMRPSRFGRALHYAWPLISVGFLAVLLVGFGDIAPDASFFVWFWLTLVLRELTLYPTMGPSWKRPRLVGTGLLFVAVVLNYASTSSTSA